MVNNPLGSTAEARISRFLDDHPYGELFVAVGYASVAGLAWLAKRTAGRPVTLLIGNAQASRFQKASAADRMATLEFLHRGDVEVKNWYQTGRDGRPARDAHLKAWVVIGPGGDVVAGLSGSANLTRRGLFENIESYGEVSGVDLLDLQQKVAVFRERAWDCRDRIIGYLEPNAPPISPNAPRARLGPSSRGARRVPPSTTVPQQPLARGAISGTGPPSQQGPRRSVDDSGTSQARRWAPGPQPVHVPSSLPPSRSRRLFKGLLTELGLVLTGLGAAIAWLLKAMVEGLVELLSELLSESPQRGRSRGGYRGGRSRGRQYGGGHSRGRQFRRGYNRRARRRYDYW